MQISSQTMLCCDKLVIKANKDVNYDSKIFWRRFHNILKFLVCVQNYIFSVSVRCLSPCLWLPSSPYLIFLQSRHSWVTFSCLLSLGFTVHTLIGELHLPLPVVHSFLKLWLWFLTCKRMWPLVDSDSKRTIALWDIPTVPSTWLMHCDNVMRIKCGEAKKTKVRVGETENR